MFRINSKILKSFALLLLLPFLMGTYCNKEYDRIEPKQGFSEKINLSPEQKTYSINDTLWLDFQTADKTLFDTISNQRLSTGTVTFNFTVILIAKYVNPVVPSGVYCDFIHPVNVTSYQQASDYGTATTIEVGCDNAPRYDLKLGIVLKHKGIYVLDIATIKLIEPCDGEVNPYPSAELLFTYNVTDTNKEIYLSIPASERPENPPGFTEKQLDKKLAYTIKVQ